MEQCLEESVGKRKVMVLPTQRVSWTCQIIGIMHSSKSVSVTLYADDFDGE